MVLGGDEFLNSQQGNNNAYCQDNKTGWLNWKKQKKNETKLLHSYLPQSILVLITRSRHRLKKEELLVILAMHRFFHKPQKKQSGNISDRLTLPLLQGNYIRTRACSIRILSQKVQHLQK